MIVKKSVKYNSFDTPEELESFLNSYSPDALFYEMSDDINESSWYEKDTLVTNRKLIESEIKYWKEQKKDTEEYSVMANTLFGYLGTQQLFYADYVAQSLENEGYASLSKKIGIKNSFVSAEVIASFYKVYGFYEKGKDHPYAIKCALKRPDASELIASSDIIRVIDKHAVIDDFGGFEAFANQLSDDISCFPVDIGEDTGSTKLVKTVYQLESTEQTVERPTLINRARKVPYPTKNTLKVLNLYDNEKAYAYKASVDVYLGYEKTNEHYPVGLFLSLEDAEKAAEKASSKIRKKKRELYRRIHIYPMTEAAYHVTTDKRLKGEIGRRKFENSTDFIIIFLPAFIWRFPKE